MTLPEPAPVDEFAISRAEERAIRRALNRCGWNKRDAAKLLGVSRATLYRKLALFDWQPVTRIPFASLGFGQGHEDEVAVVKRSRLRVDVERTGWGIEGGPDTGLHYWVVDGPTIQRRCPKIWAWVRSDTVLSYCSALAGEPLMVCPGRNSVNLNWVSKEGYQKHLDSNPYTLVLYLTDVPEGGELVVEGVGAFAPTKGSAVFFSGRHIPHEVRPCSKERLSMVISFDSCQSPTPRPPELDAHMYGEQ